MVAPTIFPHDKGMTLPQGAFFDCLTRKYKGYVLPKSNILYNIEKL